MHIARSALLGLFSLIASRSSTAFTFVLSNSNTKAPLVNSCRKMSTTAEDTMATTSTTESTKTFEESSAAYNDLLSKLRTVTQLKRASAVINYDKTVFMGHSDRTVAARGAQMSALAGLIHEKSTEKAIGELIKTASADLESFDGPTTDEARILEITKRDYEKNERIPAELEARKAALSSKAYAEWTKARQASDFSSFESTLKECFDMASEVAAAQRGENSDVPLYTQMLDEFETGMPAERIDEIFGKIQDALVPLLAKVLQSESKPSVAPLSGHFPVKVQEDLSRDIVTSLGYDDDHGRIDVSVHPFTTSFSPADVRITSRFSENEWYQGLAGTIHEGGHAMYEQNLEDSGLDIDSYLSLGCHESQSLFWERHVGLSKPFWKWAAPKLHNSFGDDFTYSPEELYGAVNAVSPGFIRVEADELTYPLHVILRYNIERDIIDGKVDVADIPKTWNEMMKEMIGVDVSEDSNGCLQDVHWSMLAIGYFPTYLLGSATAAQLAHYCKKDIPNFDEKIEKGEFSDIKAWLTNKVHKHGKRYKSLDALLEDQLGEKLNPTYFIDYLTEKYTELYKC